MRIKLPAILATLAMVAVGVATADAATAAPAIKVAQVGQIIEVTGTGFEPDAVVDASATTSRGKGTTTKTVKTDGSVKAKFQPPAGFTGLVTIAIGTAKGSITYKTGTAATPADTGSMPAPKATVPAATTQGSAASTGTWSSGNSCDGANDGSFGTWRGEPTTATATWGDAKFNSITGELKDFEGDIDIALEPFPRDGGDQWAAAASGKFDADWTSGIKTLADARTGKKGTMYIRLAWELNGNWYDWAVNSGNVASFKTAWARFDGILQANYPEGKMTFGPNHNSHSDVTAEEMWPGDEHVDALGVDIYDMYPSYTSEQIWNEQFMSGGVEDPNGMGSWQAFAKKHGVPMGFPEWGINHADDGASVEDNPLYIQLMHNFMATNAGTGPGQVAYDVYFNCSGEDASFTLFPGNANPNAAAAYKALTWGSSVGVAARQPAANTGAATAPTATAPKRTDTTNADGVSGDGDLDR